MSLWFYKRTAFSRSTHGNEELNHEHEQLMTNYRAYLQSIHDAVSSEALNLVNSSLHDAIISDVYLVRNNGLGIGVNNKSTTMTFLGVTKTNINSSALDNSILAVEIHQLDQLLEFAFLLEEGEFFMICQDARIDGSLARK